MTITTDEAEKLALRITDPRNSNGWSREAAATLRLLSAERDALLSDWRETAAIVTTDEPEVGKLWEVVGEAVGAANANREYFRREIAAHNATKAERDALAAECARMREALQQIEETRRATTGLTQAEMAYLMRSIAKAALGARAS